MGIDAEFAAAFLFTRPLPAPVRDAWGELAVAAIDAPRFDHDAAGYPLGLRIDAGDALGRGDRLRVRPAALNLIGPVTLLHAAPAADGGIVRRAYFTLDARRGVEALLSTVGHHAAIGALPGFLRNRGGFVRYRRSDWALPGAISSGVGFVTDGVAHPVIEG